jgi:hypothetical protein
VHVGIDDRGQFTVRIDGPEFRLVLLALARIDRDDLVRDARFFQQ